VPRTEQPFKHVEENERLKAKSKEWFIKGEGTRVLTFPYKTGESKVMDKFDQIYDKPIIENAVRKHSDLMANAHDYIWSNPETGYREVKTGTYMEKAFEELGYELTKAEDIPGFYTVIDTGRPGPEVMVLGELDSLICADHPECDPETGAVHCCGHSMQSATLLGIAAALKDPMILDRWSGKIRLCAVPAEELIEIAYRTELRNQGKIHYMGGKTEFLSRGYFDGVDLAFMVHTTNDGHSSANIGDVGCLSKRVIYKGVSAHAGGSPWDGCNALYAANLGLNAVNAIRETFQEKDLIRVHPIITKGGGAVNAIPDQVIIESYVRGKTLDAIKNANERVNKALCGAALALGANVDIEDVPGYAPLMNCDDMIAVVEEAVTTMTDIPFKRNPYVGTGSTDMGDLSMIMPVVHPYMPGATGISHGADYVIKDARKACTDSAIVQVYMLHILLRDNAERAIKILENFVPQFESKEAFFEYVNTFERKGDRIKYKEEGSASVKL